MSVKALISPYQNMNGYQRIKSVLAGEMPDRRPVMLHCFMTAVKEAGCTMKEYRTDPEIAARCHIDFAEKYDLDGVLFDVDTALLAGAAGVPVDFPENEPARTHVPLLSSLDEVDALPSVDISKNERIQHSLEAVKILKKYFGNEKFIRGNCDQAPFSLACAMRSPEQFMMDLLLDEENALKLIDYATSFTVQYVKLMAGTGADMVSNGDSPAGPSMISPAMYEQFAMPYEKRVVDAAKECGIPYLLHICGNTDLIMTQMNSLGLDAVELDFKTTPELCFDTFHKTTALFGTIDPSGVLALGTPQKVREECLKLLKIYENCPRFVLSAGCALPPCTPGDNIRALVQSAKDVPLRNN